MVVDHDRVMGEWSGHRWQDVPRTAALYCDDVRLMESLYMAGECERIYWKNRDRILRLTGWKWWNGDNPHTVYFTQGVLKRVAPGRRLPALLSLIERVRELGGGPSSPVGMLNSLFRASLQRPLRESTDTMPISRVWRGARIQAAVRHSTEYGPSDLWDMRSAFPNALRSTWVPRKWRHYTARMGEGLPDTQAAYVRAIVHIPWMMYGPLPDVGLHHPNFPTQTFVRGIWELSELKAAEAVGCTVFVLEYWTAHYFSQPFAEWGNLVDDLRESVSPHAKGLVKFAANRYVGRFAMDGHRERSRHVNGKEVWTVEKGQCLPESLSVHGMVTGSVRSTLYMEGIHPYPAHFIFCHTDGVALDMTAYDALGVPPSNHWRPKASMERLLLISPERYAYDPGVTERGRWRYVIAGVPEEADRRGFFVKRWAKG